VATRATSRIVARIQRPIRTWLPDASCGRFSRCRHPERSRVFVFGPRIKGLIKGYLSSHPSGESAPQTGGFLCPPVVAAVARSLRRGGPAANPGLWDRDGVDSEGASGAPSNRGRERRPAGCRAWGGAFKWASGGRDVWAGNDNSVWPALGASTRRRAGLTITNFDRCNFRKVGNDSTCF
jgi:hypothetical protein